MLIGGMMTWLYVESSQLLDAYFGRRPAHEYPQRLNIPNIQESWLYPFFQILTENCSANELPHRLSRVAVVCFNSDRCIEQFMYHAFQVYYKNDGKRSKEALDNLTIIHPYGSTGKLPWEEGEWKCAFGHKPDTETLLSISGQIKTYTDIGAMLEVEMEKELPFGTTCLTRTQYIPIFRYVHRAPTSVKYYTIPATLFSELKERDPFPIPSYLKAKLNQDLKIIKPVLSKYGINEKPVFPNLILPMVMQMETQKMN
jgi:hypothetical protein